MVELIRAIWEQEWKKAYGLKIEGRSLSVEEIRALEPVITEEIEQVVVARLREAGWLEG